MFNILQRAAERQASQNISKPNTALARLNSSGFAHVIKLLH